MMAHDDKVMTDIMKEIGCGEGFHIPVANEENRILEKEIKELLQKKATLLATNESLDNELREQKNVIANLSMQEAQNQKLIAAYRQQNETEQHMLMAAQRDNYNLSREYKTATKTLNELIENHKKSENELAKNEELINKMRETVEWGEETLLAWNNDLSKRNADVNILETYNLMDNNKFKELDLKRQHLQREVIEKECQVEKEVSELLRVERELEQTSKLSRQAQNERNKLLEQWENATNFLNSNQKDTHNIVEEINKLREVARKVYDDMNENKRKYQDYLEINEELECETNEAIKINNDLKLSIQKQISENDNVQSEVMAARKTLNILGNTLANERTKLKHMQNQMVKLKTQIQQKEEDMATLKENMCKIKNKSMTTEERLNELNTIYQNQKVVTEKLLSEKNKVLNKTFDVKNETKQLQTKIDLLTNQLEWGRNKQIALNQEESKLKKLIMEKKEYFYNLSYELEAIRIKIESKGTVGKCEMPKLQEKLQALNEELSRAKHNKGHLEKQLKSTESESRRITKEIEKNTVELETLRNRVEELNVHNEGDEKQIQSLKDQINRNHMEFMTANIKLEQMKKLTDNECEKVYSLAQQRQELTEDINKKKTEVANNYERINAERKLLLDEKSSVKRKLNALNQYIEQRRNRYQILSATLGGNSGDGSADDGNGDGNGGGDDDDRNRLSVTISEHRIRMARERLELQETGDRLDERVQKLETEVRAMENTLHLMNASNNCYKSGLSSVDPESDEYKEKIELEETNEKLNSVLSQKNKTLKKLEQEIRDLQDQYEAANEELENLIRLRDIKDGEVERAIKEVNEQMMKLNRANSRIQFDLKQIDKSCDPDKRGALELIKRDIVVRMMKKVNKSVLESLSEMSVRHIEVEPTVKRYLSEKDLELPTLSGLTLNAIKSSCGSSAASLNSCSDENSVKSVKSHHQDRDKKVPMVILEPPTPGKAFARKSS